MNILKQIRQTLNIGVFSLHLHNTLDEPFE